MSSFEVIPLGREEDLVVGRDGWAVYYRPDIGARGDRPHVLLTRVNDEEGRGRLRVTEVRVEGSGGVAAETLRSLPLARIEAAVNDPARAIKVEIAISSGPPIDPSEEAPGMLEGAFFRDPQRVAARAQTIRRLRRRVNLQFDTTGRKRPDQFYQRVAEVYMGLVASGSRRPAKEIADANPGLKVTTVHRWVKEARRRGLLAPAGERGRRG